MRVYTNEGGANVEPRCVSAAEKRTRVHRAIVGIKTSRAWPGSVARAVLHVHLNGASHLFRDLTAKRQADARACARNAYSNTANGTSQRFPGVA